MDDETSSKMEESESSDTDDGIARAHGDILKTVRGKRKSTTYYSAFTLSNTTYEIGETVLLMSDGYPQKPFVGIIKEIMDIEGEKEGNQKGKGRRRVQDSKEEEEVNKSLQLSVQWLYRPEESKQKDGSSWKLSDPRQLFYSFHEDTVDVTSVLHKCVVRVIPPSRAYPDPILQPGFVIQHVYDSAHRKIYSVTDKDYEERQQREIDARLEEHRAIWEELQEVPQSLEVSRKVPVVQEAGRLRRLKRKGEEASRKVPEVELSPARDAPAAGEEEEEETDPLRLILVSTGSKTGVSARDSWRINLLKAVQGFCQEDESLWPYRASLAVCQLESCAHEALGGELKKYNVRLRSLKKNLEITELLSKRLVSGDLSPSEVLNFSPDELKAGKRSSEMQIKPPLEEPKVLQWANVRCSNCSSKPAAVIQIIPTGQSCRYELSCMQCGNSWYANQDSIAGFSDVQESFLEKPPESEKNEEESDLKIVEVEDKDTWL